MVDLNKSLKIFFWFTIPYWVTPYTVRNNKIQIIFIQKWASITILNLISLYDFYKYSYTLLPQNLNKDPYLFLGYMRSILLSGCQLIMTLTISKNHVKIAASTTRLMELIKKLDIQSFKKVQILLCFEIFLISSGTISFSYENWFQVRANFFDYIINTYIGTLTTLGCFLAEFYFLNLLIILYFCSESINKKLERFTIFDAAFQYQPEKIM